MQLTENLLREAAGWEVMKRARFLLEQGRVLSSFWDPPLLRGVVQDGEVSFRASMAINSSIDIENLCTCREARAWGKICAHGVAVGLHWLQGQKPGAAPVLQTPAPSPTPPSGQNSALQRDAAGEPAALHIVLPPKFDQAILRGRVMLVLEAQWSGGRCPLNALPKGLAYAFPPADTAIIDKLEMLAGGETPALLQMEMKDFASLLPALAGHPNITLGKTSAVTVTTTPLQLPLRATLEAGGEIVLALTDTTEPLVRIGDWVWRKQTFQPLALPPALAQVLRAPVRLPRPQVPQFLSRDWPRLQAAGAVQANFKLEDFTLEPQAPRFLLDLKGGLAQLGALLQCAYGPRIMTVGATAAAEGDWLPDPDAPTRYSTRDLAAESAALARLHRSGFAGPDGQGRLQLTGQNAVLNFFAREFPKLQRDWSVTLEERLERSAAQNIERVQPQFRITSGLQWFDLGVVFAAAGGETFAAADIQRLLLSGQSHTRLKNGKWAVLDTGAVEELQEVLLDCAPRQQEQG